MINNDILRRLRYLLDCNDNKMKAIFRLGGATVTNEDITAYLTKEDEEGFTPCHDKEMSIFLNGLIIEKRGKKEGVEPKVEKRLNNNMILNQLKIAFQLKSDDILDALDLAGLPISNHELSSFFRKPSHRNFRQCKDQVLRNFLKGLLLKQNKAPSVWDKIASNTPINTPTTGQTNAS